MERVHIPLTTLEPIDDEELLEWSRAIAHQDRLTLVAARVILHLVLHHLDADGTMPARVEGSGSRLLFPHLDGQRTRSSKVVVYSGHPSRLQRYYQVSPRISIYIAG